MAKTSQTKRIARLEGIAIGAGFLLQQLQARYGLDFSIGMEEQVRDCIRDCQQIAKAQEQRAAANNPQPNKD